MGAGGRAGVELGRAGSDQACMGGKWDATGRGRLARQGDQGKREAEAERERERETKRETEACRLRRRCLFGDAYTVSMRRTGSPAAAWG